MLKIILSFFGSFLFILYVYKYTNWNIFNETLIIFNFNQLFFLFLLFFCFVVLNTYRWKKILIKINYQLPFNKLFKENYLGHLLNQILPSGYGGEIIKVFAFKRKTKIIESLIVDRILGLTSTLSIAFLFIIFYFHNNIILYICISLLFITILIQVNHKKIKELSIIKRLIIHFNFQMIMTSLLMQIILSSMIFVIASNTLSFNDSFLLFFILSIINLILTLPISIGGWGLREVCFMHVGKIFGIQPELCLAISIQYGIVLIITSCPSIFINLDKLFSFKATK